MFPILLQMLCLVCLRRRSSEFLSRCQYYMLLLSSTMTVIDGYRTGEAAPPPPQCPTISLQTASSNFTKPLQEFP
jgi:hypothetical protein